MKANVKIALCILRNVVSAILIFTIFNITYHLWHGWSSHTILIYIIVSILITSFLIKSDELMNSVLSGIFIGILSGLIFYLYFYITEQSSTVYVDWSLLYAFSIMFTLIWIFSCIIGGVISYFIRKSLKS